MEIRWYNLLVEPKDGSKTSYLFKTENITNDNIIICQETKRRIFAKFEDVTELIKFISKVKYSHNCFYEVIRGNYSHKWYTDIDIILEGTELADNSKCVLPDWETVEVVKHVKLALLKILPMIEEKDIAVSSSNGKTKHSYHIVLDRWCVANKEESKAIFKMIVDELPDRYKPALDPVVYKSIQQFRLYGSHKYESDRIKVFREDLSSWKPAGVAINEEHLERLRFLGFLIGNVKNCSYLPSYVKEKLYSLDDGDVSLDKEDVKEALRLFRTKFPNNGVFSYLSYSKRFITLKRNSPSYCKTCQRTHEHENPYIFIVGEQRYVYFDCRRADPNQPKFYLGRLGMKEDETNEPMIVEENPTYEKKHVMAGFTINKKISNTKSEDTINTKSEDTINTKSEDTTSEDVDTMLDSPIRIKIKEKDNTLKKLARDGTKIIDVRRKRKDKSVTNYRGLASLFSVSMLKC